MPVPSSASAPARHHPRPLPANISAAPPFRGRRETMADEPFPPLLRTVQERPGRAGASVPGTSRILLPNSGPWREPQAAGAKRAKRERRVWARECPVRQLSTRPTLTAAACGQVLQVRLGQATIPGAPQAECTHPLRQRPFDAGPVRVLGGEGRMFPAAPAPPGSRRAPPAAPASVHGGRFWRACTGHGPRRRHSRRGRTAP